MNYIKTMLFGSFVGIDKLEWLKLLQSDPLINESEIAFKESETDIESRFNNSRTYALCEELDVCGRAPHAHTHPVSPSPA